MTAFLGASLAIYGGVSPSRSLLGVARSEWAGLAVDVLLDDRQWCAAVGDGEVGRGPEVSAHACADTRAGVFAAHGVSGAALESLDQLRDCQGGRGDSAPVPKTLDVVSYSKYY